MHSLRINHAAVWVCVLLFHVLGFLWCGPLFGEQWTAMVGLDPENMEGGGAGLWVTNLVSAVAQLYALAWILSRMNIDNGVRGAIVAFVIAFCLYHLPLMRGNMFADRPYGLAWIVGGFDLLALTLSGFILGSWKKRVTSVG